MAPLTRTIGGRLVMGVLAIHLVLLPIVYFGMVYLIRQSNEEAFLNHVRGQARFVADSLERRGSLATEAEIVEILDSIVLSGNGSFSELTGGSGPTRSSLVTDSDALQYAEDFGLQQNDDATYYFSVPVFLGDEMFNLRLGFDESPYHEQNAVAFRNGLLLLAAYLLALLALLPLIGRHVAQPIRALQKASRNVASGRTDEELSVETNLVELVELARDLNLMKARLTGVNEQLEKETRERENAVLQRLSLEQQLRHSQRLETIGTMAGGIAHELNNILVPIILHAEMALEDASDKNIHDDLETVIAAANRARSIVNQVLVFGRRTEGSEQVPVDVAAAVRESVALLRASKPPDIKLDVSVDPQSPKVIGDPSLVGQLILNLCNNAIQALPSGSGKVRISLDTVNVDAQLLERNPLLHGERCLRLVVSDDGEGMDEDTRNRIFEPFFTTRDVGHGTGLGLSVVHGIVNDLNGAIEVRSTVNSGSVFRIFLPIFEPQALRASPLETGDKNDHHSVN